MIVLLWTALAVGAAAVPLRPRQRRSGRRNERSQSHFVDLARRLPQLRHRRRCPSARAVAMWCDEIARRVRSGSSLRDAAAVLPADPATARATAALRLGIDRGLTIGESVTRVDGAGPHLGLALDVLATTSRIGGPSAASIDRTAVLLRQRAADLDERSSHAAQARLSTHVMTAVPVLMLATLTITDADVRVATTSPVGITCVTVGLFLNVAGWWWMRRIIGAPP